MNDVVGSSERTELGVESPEGLFDTLASDRRRCILGVLMDEGAPVSEERLAAQVVAREEGKPVDEVTESERREAQVSCFHSHLPKVQEAGLIDWDREDHDVALIGESILRRPDIEPLVRGRTGLSPDEVTTTLSLLSIERRQTILSLLETEHALSVEELAEKVATAEHDGPPTDAQFARVIADLHHAHVPKLLQADVIEASQSEIVYRGNELLDEIQFP